MKKMLVTDADKELVRTAMQAQLEKSLEALLSPDKQISISYDLTSLCKSALPNLRPAPFIYFTPLAWLKITELVAEYTTEVAAHGTVEVTEEGDYIVTDILVYPQTIAAATVESIDEEYGPWISKLGRDTIRKLRFQFHSHVHFATSPSAKDMQYYSSMISQIDDYYIFMIINKKSDVYMVVYDKEQGVIYEDKDMAYGILTGEDQVLKEWLEEASENTHKPAPATTTSVTTAPALEPISPLYNPPPYTPHGTPAAAASKTFAEEDKDYWKNRNAWYNTYKKDTKATTPVTDKRKPGRPKKVEGSKK